MNTHRLSSLLTEVRPGAAPLPAFVPCPVVLIPTASLAQQTWMAELYRVAFERAQALHRPSRWAPLYRDWVN